MTRKEETQIKTLNIRIPKDLWLLLKKASMHYEMSMNAIIIECMEKFKEKHEKKVDRM